MKRKQTDLKGLLRNPKVVVGIVAAVIALGIGYLTLTYLGSIKEANTPPALLKDVLVVTKDIPRNVAITGASFARSKRVATEVDPDAISDPKAVGGMLALITLPAGTLISASKIGKPADVGLPVRLKNGMRAISISVDKVKGVSGLIAPGDRVDVIAIPPRSGTRLPPGRAILRGVLILAVGSTLESTGASPAPDGSNYATITLGVTLAEADVLASADMNVTLRLALRPPGEALRSAPTEALVFADRAPGGATPEGPKKIAPADPRPPIFYPAAAPVPPQAAAAPPAAAPAAGQGGVTIISGDVVVSGPNPGSAVSRPEKK